MKTQEQYTGSFTAKALFILKGVSYLDLLIQATSETSPTPRTHKNTFSISFRN